MEEDNINNAIDAALKESIGIKNGEKVIIISDEKTREIGLLFFNKCERITCTEMREIAEAEVNGQEPPGDIAESMKDFDVIIAITSRSLTHTNAVRDACLAGARCASMPGITKEIIGRSMNVDYEEMAVRTNKIKDILDKGKKARVVTEAGTDISFSIEGRKPIAGTGMLREKGLIGNLPAGEAYIAPVENTADGKYVIDGSILNRKVKDNITIIVEKGYAVRVADGEDAENLKKVLESVKDKNAYNIAELGIGTNKRSKITGNTLEDEKVCGTAHIALGKNSSMGGNIDVPIHLDGVFFRPTIYIDDEMVIKKGVIIK